MHLHVRFDRPTIRRWHVDLLEDLRSRDDTEVSVEVAETADAAAVRRLDRVLGLERRMHGLQLGALAPAGVDFAARPESPDLTLDLSSAPGDARPSWRLSFDGRYGEAGAVSALLDGGSPLVSVLDHDGNVVARARPGSENPGVLLSAYADLLAGCRTLLLGALDGKPFAEPVPVPVPHGEPEPRSLVRHAAGLAVGSVLRRGYRALYRAPHWRVGWRYVDGPDVIELMDHPRAGWHELGDDGFHFYADPFPFEHAGRSWLFVEDFDHRVGRGVISVVEFDDAGPVGAPRPVLSHEVHLSYPFVLEDSGDVWMIPETSEARRVELYRAERFPDEWICESVLLVDLEASDVTVFRREDRWWMTATVRDGGSCSDALHLWYADRLQGPWTPHRHNPVLVDIASARPAGRVVERSGRLLRPTQDGTSGYGSALTVTEITRLDELGFEQRLVGTLAPGDRWTGRRLHTLNRAGRLECIDGSAMSPRAWRPRRRA